MSESVKEKFSNYKQSSAKSFTLFEQSGIKITLVLPKSLSINQNTQEQYPCAPVLRNTTKFPVVSAKFSITLEDVIDGSSNSIASVRWWDDDAFKGKKTMSFHCGAVNPGEELKCIPDNIEYSQVRWNATVSSGHGQGGFSSTLSNVSFSFGPPASEENNDGPSVQIG